MTINEVSISCVLSFTSICLTGLTGRLERYAAHSLNLQSSARSAGVRPSLSLTLGSAP